MKSVTYRCPHCEQTGRIECTDQTVWECSACHKNPFQLDASRFDDDLNACLVCGSQEMFVRKDFPQRLGVTIVVLGFGASCVFWYFQWVFATFAVLFATAFVDVVLYFAMGNVLECYRCHAHYRGLEKLDSRDPFDLEIYERYRQQAARLKEHSDSHDMLPTRDS